MNEKEIREIRRRVRRERSNMTAIFGCYVNTQKQIISTFRQSAALMSETEAEKYFGVMRRVLSGTIGKNLIDVTFATEQVVSSPEHKLLMELRQSQLQDEVLRMELFQKVISSFEFKENYVILIGCDSYDVPFKSKDGQTQEDASTETYTYLLCAVCPVKQVKSGLLYMDSEKAFHDGGTAQSICAPELGFLFPAFDDRSSNIYNALYYTHNAKESYPQVADSLFKTSVPKPAAEQKKSFEALLTTSLADACSLETVQSVHAEICQCLDMHKQCKVAEPLTISKEQFQNILSGAGVHEKEMAKFSVAYDDAFGYDTQLHPKNIIDTNRFEIKLPDVSIKVAPEKSDLIETRIIDGVKYILICADADVEVNGVTIHIAEEEPTPV